MIKPSESATGISINFLSAQILSITMPQKYIDESLNENLFDAVIDCDILKLEDMFSQIKIPNINQPYYAKSQRTLYAGVNTDVQFLFAVGIDLEKLNEARWTMLVISILNKRFDVLKLLIQNDARLDIIDADGYTALMWAVKNRWLNGVQLLVLAGAKDTIQNEKYTNYIREKHSFSKKIEDAKKLRNKYFGKIISECAVYFPKVLIDIVIVYAYDTLPDELFSLKNKKGWEHDPHWNLIEKQNQSIKSCCLIQ